MHLWSHDTCGFQNQWLRTFLMSNKEFWYQTNAYKFQKILHYNNNNFYSNQCIQIYHHSLIMSHSYQMKIYDLPGLPVGFLAHDGVKLLPRSISPWDCPRPGSGRHWRMCGRSKFCTKQKKNNIDTHMIIETALTLKACQHTQDMTNFPLF